MHGHNRGPRRCNIRIAHGRSWCKLVLCHWSEDRLHSRLCRMLGSVHNVLSESLQQNQDDMMLEAEWSNWKTESASAGVREQKIACLQQ